MELNVKEQVVAIDRCLAPVVHARTQRTFAMYGNHAAVLSALDQTMAIDMVGSLMDGGWVANAYPNPWNEQYTVTVYFKRS